MVRYGKKRALASAVSRVAKRFAPMAVGVYRGTRSKTSTRMAVRRSGSRTMTKRKKSKTSGKAKRVADVGSTYTSYYMKGQMAKMDKRMLTKFKIRNDASLVMNSAVGRQRSQDMPMQAFDRVHLTALFTRARAAALASGYTAQADNLKLVLTDCKIKTEIKNQTNDEVQVWIYDCVARNDDVAGNTPVVDWYNGSNDQTDSTVTVDGFPYATPFDSDFFRENWRVLKVHKLQMKSGAVNTHNFYQKCNRVFSYSKFLNDGDSIFGKLTTRSFVVLLGSIGHVAATPSSVSYAAAKLDIIQTQITKVASAPAAVTFSRYDFTLPIAGTYVAMTDADETVNSIVVA